MTFVMLGRSPRLLSPFLAVLCLLTSAAQAQMPPVAELPQQVASDNTRTRFVIGLEKPVQFQVFSLSNPNRVVVEMPDVKVSLPTMAGDKPVGLVRSFRGGQAASDKMRVVIDVTEPVVVAKSEVVKNADGKGSRLAIEIMTVASIEKTRTIKRQSPPSTLGAVGVQPPVPVPAVNPKRRAERAYKPIIVIDPGHGGHDSGAMKNGTVEKDVVLAFAITLRDKLVKTGRYKVLMTRENDTFVDLDERRAFGERSNAALFIAVHADYAQSRARGATIFSLRDGVADDLKRSAKGDMAKRMMTSPQLSRVKAGEGDMEAVTGILKDLANQEVEANKDRSKLFAEAVIEKMSDATDMRSSPDQQAAFRVLKTAQFPSVLIELAYVTNKQDAENLRSDEWRGTVSESIVTAVENYFANTLSHLPM